jgi:cytochrome c peroxidase
VQNSAYLQSQFWDGREPDLEGQSAQPFINPVEMGLESHAPILEIVRTDPAYVTAFNKVFGQREITMKEVTQAIASFERTVLAGNSAFDRYQYGGDKNALSEPAIRGLKVFTGQGRCVSCHTISQTHALFTDNRFHNLGIGFERIQQDVKELSTVFSQAKAKGTDVDVAVLTNKHISELGRFAISDEWRDMGAFKTPTLRNIALTPPYMHDGSLKTLQEVVEFYNNGGRLNEPVNAFQSGGIRPLNLSEQQKTDLIVFLVSLTSLPNK